ncbi:MAG: FecR domain-containing protein [Prolixibacteraceae bacterium]
MKKDYINDPYFMQWIFRPDDQLEKFWQNYLENHPEEEAAFFSLRDELRVLKLKNEDLDEAEKKRLIEAIIRKKEQIRPASGIRMLRLSVFRYAAVAVIFLILGNLLAYLSGDEPRRQVNYPELTQFIPAGKPVLLLSDGREVDLGKNSTVEYLNDAVRVNGRTIAFIPDVDRNHTFDQVVTPKGSRCRIVLIDKSVVHLNAGSNLIFPAAFAGNEREVILSGEAFFEVSESKASPFTVQTGSIAVEVFGTRFNVSAYAEDPVIQTVLVEGKVSVRRNDKRSDEAIMMLPDQMVTYNRQTRVFETRRVDPGIFTLWKDGMLKFEEEGLGVVIHKLERFYDITVILSDPQKGNVKISGKLDLNESKSQVIEYLRALTGMRFTQLNDTYYVVN